VVYSSQGSYASQLDFCNWLADGSYILNIHGLNSKPLRSAYDVKAFVLLIAISSPDGDIKPGGPLGAFQKE
jgi:hypothetical protein